MKRIFEIVAVISVVLLSLEAQGRLKLKVMMSKSSYLVGEIVEVRVGILNTGASTIPQGYHGTTQLQVLDERGAPMPYVGLDADFFSPSRNEIGPNEESYRVVELNRFFGKHLSIATLDCFFEPGRYRLAVLYRSPDGKPESTEVQFVVHDPEGEEATVYRTYVQVMKDLPQGKFQETHRPVEILRSLIDMHPTSVYAPLILQWLATTYQYSLSDPTESIAIRKRFLEEYPGSSRVQELLKHFLAQIPSDSGRIEYLKKLKAKSKGTLMEKMYEQKLHEITAKQIQKER